MELMKKLRDAKKATGTKEDKKKVTTGVDVDIHKLLGPDYKKYRSVAGAVKQEHAQKKAATTAAPPPPPPASSALPGKKAKGGTKKKASTTIG
mmetsp:Transcript_24558/g.62643  ORF Transcript_24558/g.62643 Transcript_24558/m.62643 type:complete len:93 (-) Transcript_24558:497-775(-)